MLVPAFKHSKYVADLARLDREENLIKRNGKKHKVTFTDQVEKKPLVQVYCVESYKKYNAEDGSGAETPCCALF